MFHSSRNTVRLANKHAASNGRFLASSMPSMNACLDRHSHVPVALQMRRIATFKRDYETHVAERAAEGVPPTPLSVEQTKRVCELLQDETVGEHAWGESGGTAGMWFFGSNSWCEFRVLAVQF